MNAIAENVMDAQHSVVGQWLVEGISLHGVYL